MKTKHIFYILIFIYISCNQKKEVINSSKEEIFYNEQKKFAPIWKYLNNNFYMLHRLDQSNFTEKIDSLKSIYVDHLLKNKNNLHTTTYTNETIAIRVAFDKYILEYPKNHQNFTGKKVYLSKKNQQKINVNLLDFNQPKLLSSNDFIRYVESFISIEIKKKLQNGDYNKIDNQQLVANWNVIETLFTNTEVNTFWKEKYLYEHIDNNGIKNTQEFYNNLISNNKNNSALTKLINLYKKQHKERASHTIEIYKTVDNFQLEMHLFLPDKKLFKGNRPAIVQFHGGSWSIGNPFWFFSTAKEYAKNGWVVAVVD